MNNIKPFLRQWMLPFIDPRKLISVVRLPKFFFEFLSYVTKAEGQQVPLGDTYPCLADRTAYTAFDPHYFYQGAWLSRQLSKASPKHHIDVASSVLTMSVLSAWVPTTFVDYRPLNSDLSDLNSIAGDVTCLPFDDGSVDSLSCLHVIEHVGLGRYGDPLDPNGSHQAAQELQRILKPEGRLYLSVPVGRERVCFNAHRVFSPHTIVSMFSSLQLCSFALIDDDGKFWPDASLTKAENLSYGCGLYEFSKA